MYISKIVRHQSTLCFREVKYWVERWFKGTVKVLCKHEWEHPDRWVHDENHGPDPYERRCVKCSLVQHFCYYRWGEKRYGWEDSYYDEGV